jgi:DNA-binding ferritin-like protein
MTPVKKQPTIAEMMEEVCTALHSVARAIEDRIQQAEMASSEETHESMEVLRAAHAQRMNELERVDMGLDGKIEALSERLSDLGRKPRT